MTVTIYMYIDWQLAVNGRNVVKNDKTKIKKWMLWEDLHRISPFVIYFNVVVWLLRIATPEIESKIWIGKSMSERRIFFYLINFLTKLKWVLMQEHNKLYCTFWKQGCIWYIFFDLMQIVTQTQLLLSINTQILDNCSNKQKDNSMNKDDNKDKTIFRKFIISRKIHSAIAICFFMN